MQGRDYLDRILEYGQTEPTSIDFLNEIAKLPLDGHDAKGMVFIAGEALAEIDEDDPFHAVFSQIAVGYGSEGRRFDRHDARGILTLCQEAFAQVEAPSFAP